MEFKQLFGKAPGEGERAVGLLVLDVVESSGASGADQAAGLTLAFVDTVERSMGRPRAIELLRGLADAIEAQP